MAPSVSYMFVNKPHSKINFTSCTWQYTFRVVINKWHHSTYSRIASCCARTWQYAKKSRAFSECITTSQMCSVFIWLFFLFIKIDTLAILKHERMLTSTQHLIYVFVPRFCIFCLCTWCFCLWSCCQNACNKQGYTQDVDLVHTSGGLCFV